MKHSLSTTFEFFPVAIILVNQDARIEVVNQAFSAQFGYPSMEVQGTPLYQLLSCETKGPSFHKMKSFLGAAKPHTLEWEARFIRKDGQWRWVHIQLGAMGTNKPSHSCYRIVSITDISWKKNWEPQLIHVLYAQTAYMPVAQRSTKPNIAVLECILNLQKQRISSEQSREMGKLGMKQMQNWLKGSGASEEKKTVTGVDLCTFIPELVYQRQKNSVTGEKTNIHMHIDAAYLPAPKALLFGFILDQLLCLYFSQPAPDMFAGKLAIRLVRQEKTDHYQLEAKHNKGFIDIAQASASGVEVPAIDLLLAQVESLNGRLKMTSGASDGTLVSITFYNLLQPMPA
jgi:PAS domain S-box-containing protein